MGETVKLAAEEEFEAYLARPEGTPKGAIIVIHEVWGLNDHTKDIAERLTKQGYLALAPDLLSSSLDIKGIRQLQEDLFDAEKRNSAQPKLRELMAPIQSPAFAAKTLTSLKECFDYLYAMPDCHETVFVMGYCFGGTYSFSLAIEEPLLKGAVAYYGHADQEVAQLANIKCPVQAFYGEKDERLISGLDDLKRRMSVAKVDFSVKVYPDCGHAFFNDTNEFAYNRQAAEDSWRITLEFLAANS